MSYEDPAILFSVVFRHCNVEWEVVMTSPTTSTCDKCGATVEPISYEEEDKDILDSYGYEMEDPYYRNLFEGDW